MIPPLGVVPTFVIFTPLALLAALMPAVFGGWLITLRRWRAILLISCAASTLSYLHVNLRKRHKESWWAGQQATIWAAMILVSAAGTFWAWRRQRTAAGSDPLADLRPKLREHIALGLVSLTGLWALWLSRMIQHPILHPVLVVWLTAWAGSLYQFFLSWRSRQGRTVESVPSVEVVMLVTLTLACAGFGARTLRPHPAVLWTFEGNGKGTVYSSPLVENERVYLAAALDRGALPHGEVYCLDAATGKDLWNFSDGGGMRPVFSSPSLADGRLYIGEGVYEEQGCKLYCVEASSGRKLWAFQTGGRTASLPSVVDGRLFFSAGVDGLYCLDAMSGAKLWHLPGVPVEVSPAVIGEHLFAGSSTGTESEIFCLDAGTGRSNWRVPVDLPVVGSPALAGDQLFVGIGNGTYWGSAAEGAGALLCVGVRTGSILWRFPTADAVFTKPAMDDFAVYFGSRDGYCYSVDRHQGTLRWKRALGSGVWAAPVLRERGLYVVSNRGQLIALDAMTGEPRAAFDVAAHSQTKPLMYSTPAFAGDRVYLGAGLADLLTGFSPTVYCLRAELRGR